MMMRQSSILKWTQSKNKNNNNNSSGKNWIHPPDALQRGHVAYLVKFLGHTEVDEPKGIEVVKEGIRKMKFSEHLKRAEGSKTPKVELTISIDGVAVQEPKGKKILHQFPLHHLSYCADDKTEKKFFSFIAKDTTSDHNVCFVFVSDKLAEEITLTIGQAFDLAYRRFLETSGRDLEMRRQLMVLQKRVQELEKENSHLKNKLEEYEKSNHPKSHKTGKKQLNGSVSLNSIGSASLSVGSLSSAQSTLTPLPKPPPVTRGGMNGNHKQNNHHNQEINLLDMSDAIPTVGRKLENLDIDDMDSLEDFNPRADDNNYNQLNQSNGGVNTNPVQSPNGSESDDSGQASTGGSDGQGLNGFSEKDVFGSEPFNPNTVPSDQESALITAPETNGHHHPSLNGHKKTSLSSPSKDPFGMGSFEAKELEDAIGAIDKKLAEMRDGFSRGLSFGNDNFSLESLDPLAKR